MNRIQLMREKLAILNPLSLQIQDESHKHATHAGAAGGGGHYLLSIESLQFVGKTTMARHRMIYSALGEMMQQEIHALNIKAITPQIV